METPGKLARIGDSIGQSIVQEHECRNGGNRKASGGTLRRKSLCDSRCTCPGNDAGKN